MNGLRSLSLMALLFIAMIAMSRFGGDYFTAVALSLAMWIALTQSWLLLSGLTGYLSLGHSVFFGIGVYVGVLLWGSLPLWLIMLLGGGISGLFALAVGYPALRVRGPYFVMLSFGLAELVKYMVTYIEARLGEFGRLALGAPAVGTLFLYMLALAIAATSLTYLTVRSRYGYGLRAIRENEEAAETLGVPIVRYKLAAFALSAIIPGMVGVVMMMRWTFFDPMIAFDPVVSFTVVTMAMIGGKDTASGPLVGTVFLTVLSELLWAHWPQVYMVLLGALLIVFVRFAPNGLVGWTMERFKGARP